MPSSKRKRSMRMSWAASALLGVPIAASAGSMITYHCVGESVDEGGDPLQQQKTQVVADYTLDWSTQKGRYWDWSDPRWQPVHAIKGSIVQLARETVGPGMHGWWELSIDRSTGAWSQTWAGGQHTTTVNGHCQQVALRRPPH